MGRFDVARAGGRNDSFEGKSGLTKSQRSRGSKRAHFYIGSAWQDDQPVESWVSTLASVFRSSHSRKAFSVIKRHRPTRTVGRSLC